MPRSGNVITYKDLKRGWTSRKIATIVLLGALGGVSSFAIGWGGTMLSLTPLGPIGGQALSGLHIFWLIIAAALVQRHGAATATGALKGMIEMMLPSHLGVFVFIISLFEGAVVDIVFLPLRRAKPLVVLLAGGLASASNLIVLQLFQFLPSAFSFTVYLAIYGASFVSGLVLGGYLSSKILKVAGKLNSNDFTSN